MLRSLCIAFSMYSRIPVPHCEWREKDMRYALCFFPLVGAVLAALLFGWLWLWEKYSSVWGAGDLVRTVPLLLIPIAVTGGIHLDGFMDTSDALSSFRPLEKRLEILKDPHIGAFAVISLLLYCAVYLASASLIRFESCAPWCAGFVLSRILSAIAVLCFPCAKKTGSLYTFAKGAARRRVLVLLCVELSVCVAFMLYCSPLCGLCLVLLALIVFFYYRVMSVRKFGGITGDLAGWFLCVCELALTVAQGVFCAAARGFLES